MHPHDIPLTLSATQTCASGKISYLENRYRHKDGEYRVLSWKVLQEEDGLVYAAAQDITQTKLLEGKLSDLQECLNAFFKAAPVGRAIFDQQMRFVQLNETLPPIDDISAEEHLGKTYAEVLPRQWCGI